MLLFVIRRFRKFAHSVGLNRDKHDMGDRDSSSHTPTEQRTKTGAKTTQPRIGKYGVEETQTAAKFLIACCCLLLVASHECIGRGGTN